MSAGCTYITVQTAENTEKKMGHEEETALINHIYGAPKSTITEYSVGFLHDDTRVVLIQKSRPSWQAGLLNGVGGHLEQGEDGFRAMRREFKEETGVYVPVWEKFLTLEGAKSRIHCFASYDTGNWINQVTSTTDEPVFVVKFADMLMRATVPNIRWIIPLMRQRGNYYPITVKFHGE